MSNFLSDVLGVAGASGAATTGATGANTDAAGTSLACTDGRTSGDAAEIAGAAITDC